MKIWYKIDQEALGMLSMLNAQCSSAAAAILPDRITIGVSRFYWKTGAIEI